MEKNKLSLFAVLVLLLVLPFTVFSASATTVSTFTVSQSSQIQFLLPAGTTFNGSISVSSTLRFWVNSPSGYQIVNLGLIDQSEVFGFVAQEDGNYTMNFENGLPYANPVQVTFSYTTNPDVTSNDNSTGIPLTYWLAIVLIIIVGVVLIVVLRYRKDRNHDSDDYGGAVSNPSENLPSSNLLCRFRALLTITSSSMAFSMRLLMAWFRLPPK
jgi:hypothetical protein